MPSSFYIYWKQAERESRRLQSMKKNNVGRKMQKERESAACLSYSGGYEEGGKASDHVLNRSRKNSKENTHEIVRVACRRVKHLISTFQHLQSSKLLYFCSALQRHR